MLPSGESAAEYPELEAVEQVAETVDNNVALSTAETINRTQMVYVYVCGAVYSPGVVKIAEGSRAEEALRLAQDGADEGGMRSREDVVAPEDFFFDLDYPDSDD